MRLVAGLGNPGKRYESSRHNLGFAVVERVAARLGVSDWKAQFQGRLARGQTAQGPFLLLEPQTYMNLSGESVAEAARYFRVDVADCLVVVDDLDLPPGKIRTRLSGSDGGHRGLRSVIQCLGSRDIKRLRIGIGRPAPGISVTGHVLGGSEEETRILGQACDEAAGIAIRFLETGQFENWSSPGSPDSVDG
jgi:PTH1 family peptidyl-tRNA hydrolase